MKKYTILVVDDQPENIDFLAGHLGSDFNILAANGGEKAIQVAQKNPELSLVVLDIVMPGMDGYETCRRLKAGPSTQHIDVIFVSSKDSVEEIMLGYEAGGSDYLVKPVRPKELTQKIKLVIKNRQIHNEIEKDKSMAMETAMTAITSGGEQGVLLDFMSRSFEVKSIENLARLIVDCCVDYQLDVSVQIRGKDKVVNASKNEPVSPLEKEFLLRVKNAGRLREKGEHFVANFGDITLLAKNMPDEEGIRGRLRDHLAILLESAEIRLKTLEMESQILQVTKSAQENLKEIEIMQSVLQKQFSEILDDMTCGLETSFFSFGLTEDQENQLMVLIRKGIDQSMSSLDIGKLIDKKLRMIVKSLEDISDQCQTD